MANTLITPTMMTRKALRILHQKLNFIGSINRQYDEEFGKSGGKIGGTLKIRMPNQFTVRSGQVMAVQDVVETSQDLTVSTVKGVDMNFDDIDLALSLDDFSGRYLEPAMTVLASAIEADALNMINDVYNTAFVTTVANALDFTTMLKGKKRLDDSLAPNAPRTALLSTQNMIDVVSDVKGLFQDSASLAKQYRDGAMGRLGGFDFVQNTLMNKFTSGTETAAGTAAANGANQSGAAITITNGSSKTFKKGDVITFAGTNRVHPETKADTGALHQFVVTADVSSVGTSIAISPSIVLTGAKQNCTAAPTDAGKVLKVGGIDAGKIYDNSIVFHEDAFTFVTADLMLPKNQQFAARQVQDGISMRIWQGADIINGKFPCRIDILYGYKTIRPQLACRLFSNAA